MTKKINEKHVFCIKFSHSLVIEWKMSTILAKNKMNGIKKIDSFTKMFCSIQIGRT